VKTESGPKNTEKTRNISTSRFLSIFDVNKAMANAANTNPVTIIVRFGVFHVEVMDSIIEHKSTYYLSTSSALLGSSK
jgi:hypothetical protein